MAGNFGFLLGEWPELHEPARRAELAVFADPRAACFYARRCLELGVEWAFRVDGALVRPYDSSLSALLHAPSFKAATGPVWPKAQVIRELGNLAVHRARSVSSETAMRAVGELFQFCYWLARTYSRQGPPAPGLAFDPARVERVKYVTESSLEAMRGLQRELEARDAQLAAERAARERALAEAARRDEELERLRAEVAAAKAANAAVPDAHDYAEDATRDLIIDVLLAEAGWELTGANDREFEVAGMPTAAGVGFVDYVLWGDDGLPLAVIEAKRTGRDPVVGQQQAKLYADCVEARYARRPVIFYSNGYDTWLWDDASYPPRRVQGFYTKAALELMVQRRSTRGLLADADVAPGIAGRYYQVRAIKRIGEAFEADNERKALLVMATGAGKTRTVIGLVDMLMRAGWVKRVLFLADRIALVNQAANAFKAHLPDSPPVNLVTEKAVDGRVYVSTYPTMMGLIDSMSPDGRRRFGVDYFDLIVIDEAHRSVFAKYAAIFDYFDSLLVGLTATPKDEVDRSTYRLFDLEDGVPTDAYPLAEAVADGYLVPPRAVSVPLRFVREGISYDELSEDEKDQWDALDWDDSGDVPDRVEAEAVNTWLFNADTVDKVLAHVMTHGVKVAGGDRLAKTILFAKNQAHADFIAQRFDIAYPELKGAFARVISYRTEYAQSLIDDFSTPDKAPHLAISVDMLDTGIDIPEVANLVFFKLIRSKTKFWQMLGRGTRLCPDLFGPGADKAFFYLFDYCQNLEYFSQDLPPDQGNLSPSLGQRLFTARLDLIRAIDADAPGPVDHPVAGEADATVDPASDADVRRWAAHLLHRDVAAMNVDNFIVRPHRRLVDRFADPAAWHHLTDQDAADATATLAGLPTTIPADDEDARRFDLLILNLQLAQLRHEPAFTRLSEQVKTIAAALQTKAAIPMVAAQMPLILDLQTDPYWTDITAPLLEIARRRIRGLVAFIDRAQRHVVYTDFTDQLGAETPFLLPGLGTGASGSLEKFRAKTAAYLREHLDIDAVHKLHTNQPITADDVSALEQVLIAEGLGNADELARAADEAHGLGLFVRSIVGLDRQAARAAMADFAWIHNLNAAQIHFTTLVVDYLCRHGVMNPGSLYEAPFTDIAAQGPDELFTNDEVDTLIDRLEDVRHNAMAGMTSA